LDEEDVKRLADLMLRIEDRIRELEEELETLREISQLIDSLLRKRSFLRASQVPPPEESREEEARTRILSRPKDGLPLATARIYEDKLVIDVNPELPLRTSIPPFKSFFINRILESMKEKDRREAAEGRIEHTQVLDPDIRESPDGRIELIEIRNVSDNKRVNEILNTLTWTLTKMLEKIEGSSA